MTETVLASITTGWSFRCSQREGWLGPGKTDLARLTITPSSLLRSLMGELIQTIPAGLERTLGKNLTAGETVVIKLKGAWKEALVCTDRRVLILKSGFMTGQMFGSDFFQLPYPAVASAEVKFHLISGYFEVSAGGMQNTAKSYWSADRNTDPAKAPNCVSLNNRSMANTFRQACTAIMEMAAASRVAPTSASGEKDMAGAIERLWKLHTDGALTRDEFEAGKAKLLA